MDTEFGDWLPAVSSVQDVTVYVTPFESWLVESWMFHGFVLDAVTDVCEVCQLLPLHQRLSLERWTLTRVAELGTPELASVAVPQIRELPDEHPPPDQVVEL